MTVGETLTEARYQAGLSVEELSERTRIRGTVIRSIEQDDYGACGGDLYVRGYVRAIAGAVGIDAQPLIREYDQGRVTSQDGVANDSASHSERSTWQIARHIRAHDFGASSATSSPRAEARSKSATSAPMPCS